MSDTCFTLCRPEPDEERLRRLVVQLPDGMHRRFKQLAAHFGRVVAQGVIYVGRGSVAEI